MDLRREKSVRYEVYRLPSIMSIDSSKSLPIHNSKGDLIEIEKNHELQHFKKFHWKTSRQMNLITNDNN